MIRFALFVALALGAAYYLYQFKNISNPQVVLHNLKKKISEGQFTEVADFEALTEARKIVFGPGLTYVDPDSNPNDPRLRFQYLHNNTSAVVPGDSVMSRVTLLKGKPVRLTLENSSDYEIIRMFGSRDPLFAQDQLVFDWSKRGLNSYLFHEKAFRYPYYRVQFKSVINRGQSREVQFFIADKVAIAPQVRLTYQPLHGGTKSIELKPTKDQNQNRFKAQVSENSLLGLKVDLAGQKLIACSYKAPGSQASSCQAQVANGFVANVTKKDIGLHYLSIKTDQSEYQFIFEIERVQ